MSNGVKEKLTQLKSTDIQTEPDVVVLCRRHCNEIQREAVLNVFCTLNLAPHESNRLTICQVYKSPHQTHDCVTASRCE